MHAHVPQWTRTRAVQRRSVPRVPARTVGVIASMSAFMAFLDNTVVGIAYPSLLKSFPRASGAVPAGV